MERWGGRRAAWIPAMALLAGCSLMGMFEEEPDAGGPRCEPGQLQEFENACGVCSTGTQMRRCTAAQVWEDLSCADPLDADGDTYANAACAARPEGCCTELRDCNDGDAEVHPDAPECTHDDGSGAPATQGCTMPCGTAGTTTCGASCGWEACAVAEDECDGLDDDCDTLTDEDQPCVAGAVVDCETACRSTGRGPCSESCDLPGREGCVAPAETCNGLDDDCDTYPDNGFPCVRGAAGACTTGCGSIGTGYCTSDCQPATVDTCTAPPETCSGVDDDCDTEIDEGFPCIQGMLVTCTTACGSAGTGSCSPTCALPGPAACTPPTERCGNMVDDDCDTETDELEPGQCRPGTVVTCLTPCASTGTGICTAGCVPPDPEDCTAAAEICDGVDNDCDTIRDNGYACVRGTATSCATSCGTTGTGTCTMLCEIPAPAACTVPAETCNAVDDNCDGATDETFACVRGSTQPCTTTCGTPGSGYCTDTCLMPGAAECAPPSESCNAVDDDCDGATDESFTCIQGQVRSCAVCGGTGSQTCLGDCSGWTACARSEECNACDDDADGATDEGFECVQGGTGTCTTTCGSTGTRICSATCTWGSCSPPVETCNGVDDDCIGGCDDGWSCCRGTAGSCIATCGTTGSRTCSPTCSWGSCVPPAEICNGADDDCDTLTDETFACMQGSTGSCTTSCGSSGSRTCNSSCSWGSCVPPAEVCNGADDDCDTTADQTFTCMLGATEPCTTTCDSTGSRACGSSCTWGSCTPPVEICNSMDEDCDGATDETFECIEGSTGSCATSCGSTGTHVCSSTCEWGSCNAPMETCNGVDDDCIAGCDDTFECCRGSTGGCATSCGTPGTRTCSTSCAWGFCVPYSETCNGVDDDCDGSTDEIFMCIRGSTASCVTSCGSSGTRTCSTSCAWGACVPPTEICNGADEDCDTACDDGFDCCAGSSGPCTTSCGSTGTHVCSPTCEWGSCNLPTEVCNGADDDCDTSCDEGYGCCAGLTQSCGTICGSTGTRTCSTSCTWDSCVPPTEICNGVDDDCDTTTDEDC